MLTQAPRTTYVPLSTAKSWYDYYTRISDKNMITGLILPDLKPLQDNIEMACALSASTVETTSKDLSKAIKLLPLVFSKASLLGVQDLWSRLCFNPSLSLSDC